MDGSGRRRLVAGSNREASCRGRAFSLRGLPPDSLRWVGCQAPRAARALERVTGCREDARGAQFGVEITSPSTMMPAFPPPSPMIPMPVFELLQLNWPLP
jgi:hypothetical protein